jgi:hypothetical protein
MVDDQLGIHREFPEGDLPGNVVGWNSVVPRSHLEATPTALDEISGPLDTPVVVGW